MSTDAKLAWLAGVFWILLILAASYLDAQAALS